MCPRRRPVAALAPPHPALAPAYAVGAASRLAGLTTVTVLGRP